MFQITQIHPEFVFICFYILKHIFHKCLVEKLYLAPEYASKGRDRDCGSHFSPPRDPRWNLPAFQMLQPFPSFIFQMFFLLASNVCFFNFSPYLQPNLSISRLGLPSSPTTAWWFRLKLQSSSEASKHHR